MTLDEISECPEPKRGQMLDLKSEVALLKRTERTVELAAYYIEQKLVPSSTAADALYLAHCSQHEVPYRLTWNCRHLANVNKIRHLIVLSRRLGLVVLVIVTPLTLLRVDPL